MRQVAEQVGKQQCKDMESYISMYLQITGLPIDKLELVQYSEPTDHGTILTVSFLREKAILEELNATTFSTEL